MTDRLCISDFQQQGDFILIQDLQVERNTQAEYGPYKKIVQVDNVLVLTNLRNNTVFLASLKEFVVRYSSTAADDVLAPLLEAHIVQSIMYQKQLVMHEWEILCYLQKEITRIHHWMINTFPMVFC